MKRSTPPFRADHVGSLLRPPEILEARSREESGEITKQQLREIEDRCIRDVVKLQEDAGLEAITDGEFRRFIFHIDFLKHLEGVEIQGGIATKFHKKDGDIDYAPPKLVVSGKLRHTHGIQTQDFKFLQSITGKTPKITIPSPTMVHFRGGRDAISKEIYPDMEEFFADLAECYRQEVKSLADAGCRYLQLDDTNLAYLCDPKLRQGAKDRGDDPDELPRRYAALINASLEGKPDDMVVCIHLCRGNFRSAWVSEGGYEPVAEVLFNEINVNGFFLEYDDERSGDFAPLRLVPKEKIVVLGLVTSKTPQLESKDELKQRIDEAARYIPLDQLCLSPQCGFSSVVYGNELSVDDEIAKLRLVTETAAEVWG